MILEEAEVTVKLASENELSAVRNIDWDLGFSQEGTSNDGANEGKEIQEMVTKLTEKRSCCCNVWRIDNQRWSNSEKG